MTMEKIVIIGYGGHAKSVVDSIKSTQSYEIVGYTDVEDKNRDLPYLGTDERLKLIFYSGVKNVVFGLGYMGKSTLRDKLFFLAKNIGFVIPTIIDPSAVIADDVRIGEGTFIGKYVVVNAGSCIGKMCIINTGSIVEHENQVGDFTHIAVGTVLCGNVKIGDHCLIGANSTVLQGLSIGNHTIIGGGSIVLKDVENNVVRFGKIGGGVRSRINYLSYQSALYSYQDDQRRAA